MGTAETVTKWVTILGSVVGVFWGIISALETRAIDARKPFLDLQLKLYQDATKSAAILATSSDPKDIATAESRFWQLYWGELAMVENGGIKTSDGGVEGAMVAFGNELNSKPRNVENLQRLSLRLAHVCRDSLAKSWGVPDWRAPDYGQ